MDNQNHVYILGAGFSVPLGGPLFTQLLSSELYSYVNGLELNGLEAAIRALHFDAISRSKRNLDAQLGRWYNAEELLELVDWAVYNSSTHKAKTLGLAIAINTFQGATDEKCKAFFESLSKQLRRVIACQCEVFLTELDNDSERWKPYLAWFEKLKANDTIITFNYDTAVERIAELVGKPFPTKPGAYESGRPRLIKLHGSADWYVDTSQIRQMKNAYQNDVDIAIGMPGNAKAKITEAPLFDTLWRSARIAIEQAAFVSIVGYSMPATDNNARMMILDSIAKGKDTIRRVNLVLGPDMGTIRAKRMWSILQPLMGRRKDRVTDVSMFTQDYLSRVSDYLTYDF